MRINTRVWAVFLGMLPHLCHADYEPMHVQVEFHQLASPDLIQTQPFNQEVASGMLTLANQVWGQCGIVLNGGAVTVESISAVSEIQLTESDRAVAKRELYRIAGKPEGSSAYDRYFNYLAGITGLTAKVSRVLWNRLPEQVGQRSIPVLVMPDARILSPDLSSSFTHGQISASGAREFYYYGTESPAIETTTMISLGYAVDVPVVPAADLVVGDKWSVLAHEIGHFFGLNHAYVSTKNLMQYNSNFLMPNQCEFARNFLKKKLGHDVLAADGSRCRAHVAQNICVTSSGPDSNVVCGEASGYVERFLEIYDEYPDALKRELCALQQIRVVPGLTGSAETKIQRGDDGTALGFSIWFRQALVDQYLRIGDFMTWKEQLSFGGPIVPPQAPVAFDASLPVINFRSPQGSNEFLIYLLAHELGHVVDLRLRHEARWQPFSWVSHGSHSDEPLAGTDFPHRADLCFYFCGGHTLSPSIAPRYYADLMRTNFVTGYAAQDSWEDYAETFALEVLDQFKGISNFSLTISPEAGPVLFDLLEHLRSDALLEKRAFMRGDVESRP